jgi:hypothetical protein
VVFSAATCGIGNNSVITIMLPSQDNLWTWAASIAAVIVIVYLLPFLIALWIKPIMLVWGFIVGRRRRKEIIAAEFPESNNGADNPGESNNPGKDDRDSVTMANDIVRREMVYLNEMHKERLDYLNSKLTSYEERLQALDESYQERQESDRKNFPGNVYYKSLELLNGETVKHFLLLILMAALFWADTLIAQQVFTSLGLFPTDKYTIFGKEIPLTLILGLFLTFVAALFLHIVWKKSMLQSVKDRKTGIVLGCSVLVVLAVLRLISVVSPNAASPVIEGALILGWILGVIVFYWLLEEILGEPANWLDFAVAIGTPILLVLVVLFGTLFLLEKIFESLLKLTVKGWIRLGQARTTRKRDNSEESKEATTRGFYRGLTT